MCHVVVPPAGEVEACVSEPASSPIVEALPGRLTDLGGLAIRPLLPRSQRRLVGPRCFFRFLRSAHVRFRQAHGRGPPSASSSAQGRAACGLDLKER